MITPHWYAPVSGDGVELRRSPRPASWNKKNDIAQIALRTYLDDTSDLVAPLIPSAGPWSLRLDVGLPDDANLVAGADLDNYGLPVAARLRNSGLVSVWCTKGPGGASRIAAGVPREVPGPSNAIAVRTTASAEGTAYKEQVRSAVGGATELPAGPVTLEVSFVVGPSRNWLNLWKPTIDALDPLLGRSDADREWHPRDDRITQLGLHVTVDPSLRYEVVLAVAASPEPGESTA